jgi:transposase-like protein
MKIYGKWAYLYRAVDSAGETIEFMLSPKRGLIAAKLFLRLVLSGHAPTAADHPCRWPSRVSHRDRRTEAVRGTQPTLSLPNVALFEQSHRTGSSIHKEAGHGEARLLSAEGACRTIEGYEAMHAIRKRRLRWVQRTILSVSVNSSTRSVASPRKFFPREKASTLRCFRSAYLQRNRFSGNFRHSTLMR